MNSKKKTGPLYRRECPVEWCKRKTVSGTCTVHRNLWVYRNLCCFGWVRPEDCRAIAKILIHQTEINDRDRRYAIQTMRGRHPFGPWEQRPAPRLTPIRAGFYYKGAINNILVGRRRAPNLEAIVSAIVQRVLQEAWLGNDVELASSVAGAHFMGRRGLIAPPGKEIDKGIMEFKTYRLNFTDQKRVGVILNKVAKKIGLNTKDPELRFRICQIYSNGIDAGTMMEPFKHLMGSKATKRTGDDCFTVYLDRHWKPIPPEFRNKIQRGTGKIDGEYRPELAFVPLMAAYKERRRARSKAATVRTPPLDRSNPPDHSFIFDNFTREERPSDD